MDPSEYFAGGNPSDQQSQTGQHQICGPRPSPLILHKDSHKIRKPPKHPKQPPNCVYPKLIKATVSDFKSVVKRFTGISSGDFLKSGSGGDVSLAARLASTENASPRGKKPTARAEYGGHSRGILSPSPAMLPTASAGIFSPMKGGMFSPAVPPGLFSPARLVSPILMYSPGYPEHTSTQEVRQSINHKFVAT